MFRYPTEGLLAGAVSAGHSDRNCSPVIAFVCSYEGFITEAGAEGVGKSTATAVVITSVTILVLDTLTAALFAPYLQT